MSSETTPAVKLRNQVVTEVVRAIIGLTFLLYITIGVLVFLHRAAPGELWLAAGNASGALVALLVNSKNDAGPPPPIEVVGVPGGEPVVVDPVAVDPVPDEPAPEDAPADEPPLEEAPLEEPPVAPVDFVIQRGRNPKPVRRPK